MKLIQKNTKKLFYVTAILLFTLNLYAQQLPYQNPNLSANERATDLISRLTLSEKAALMCDQSEAIPRLGIKQFNWWSEALHGLANNDSVTVFPEPIGMAASFDDGLVFKIFSAFLVSLYGHLTSIYFAIPVGGEARKLTVKILTLLLAWEFRLLKACRDLPMLNIENS